MLVLAGSPRPLGATWDEEGVNFAIFSAHAEAVELCLIAEDGSETIVELTQRTASVWHAYIPGLPLRQRYAYRVHGPYDPARGHRFNPNVRLLDPYAKAVDRTEDYELGCFAYDLAQKDGDLHPVRAPVLGAPRGVVVDTSFDWEDDAPPDIPLRSTVLYEAHVRGFTMLHPEVPPELRGTYLGMAHPAVIRYLRELGVTAVELMPVHAFVDDKVLLERGLRNYWGYSSIGFFAPDVRYRSGSELGSEVRQFKQLVKTLHRAGIEVLLDVVYNHTAEGNHLGPTFSFKGIDNASYYKLVKGDQRYYFDTTGTGNTLNSGNPQVLTLIMDSLRYWASEMHVDGFRFDLAASLARELDEVDQLSSFFTLLHQSPTLNRLKLIAEPWDVGTNGYQVGNFPALWAEWNGRYRDTVRSFWRGDAGQLGELAYRLTGSSDLYQRTGRTPAASINFVTSHDGLTIADVVTYEHKHNEANGEGNRDGNDDERASNHGVEGPTDDPGVLRLRRRQQRNLLATLLLSQGTPMLLAGDERARTQRGNNNAYCQDNELSWLDWTLDEEGTALLAFTRRVIQLRAQHPALRRSKFFSGEKASEDMSDVSWLDADGQPLPEERWHAPEARTLGMFLAGRGVDDTDETGQPLFDDNLYLMLNAGEEAREFVLPAFEAVREPWELLLDTADDQAERDVAAGARTLVEGRSLQLFRSTSRVLRKGGLLHRLGATYRLQFHNGFGFEQALSLTQYLQDLGVTDVYASPLLRATRGSTHGYDVVDHGTFDPELGGEAGFSDWSDELRRRGLGLLLDFVPNHMGIAHGENALWDDVLEHGPSSLNADFFDIDWDPPRPDLHGRVLLPILDGQYGEVLERGELRVSLDGTALALKYFERRLPLALDSLGEFLSAASASSGLSDDDEARRELDSIVFALSHLPPRTQTAREDRRQRARESRVIRGRLAELLRASSAVREGVGAALLELNGSEGVSASFDALDRLLSNQSYRLASWRVAVEEINYRRFFDVNELVAVRMESQAVFDRAHALLFRMIDEQRVNALRLDHTDGLYDPHAYFVSLQTRFVSHERREARSPDDAARPLPILVEKILGTGEQLPSSWPVDGTTGYDFAALVRGLWVDPRAESALTALYRRFTGDARSFSEHVYASKLYVLEHALVSEVTMLAGRLQRIACGQRKFRDFTLASLTRALKEVMAALPIYRTYLRHGATPRQSDERLIHASVRLARRRTPELNPSIFDFLLQQLLGGTSATEGLSAFALLFQQLTGPVMAKSVEDTAFFRYTRLVCQNDVGGTPARFGTGLREFHEANHERSRTWPFAMLTTSTHDGKRGEDAAARLAVLSEVPETWSAAARRWRDILQQGPSEGAEREPDAVQVYALFQELVGAWPFGWDGREGREELAERLKGFALKAAREAKQSTSWLTPDPAYERATTDYVARAFENDAFVEDVRRFCELIAPYAASNGLAQCLLRLCAPGVPDTYQGAELGHQRMIDPDNRQPVDFERRRRALEAIRARASEPGALARELLGRYADGDIKLYVTHIALQARKAMPELFLRGSYEELHAGEHAVAFMRAFGDERLICVVPRFAYGLTQGKAPWALGEVWGGTALELRHGGSYQNLLTGAKVELDRRAPLRELCAELPLALLVAKGVLDGR